MHYTKQSPLLRRFFLCSKKTLKLKLSSFGDRNSNNSKIFFSKRG
nr:MAG TPA: hypothetical protein [Caudoviricetes sp.]